MAKGGIDLARDRVLGVDIGGTFIKWVVLTEGAVTLSGHLSTPPEGPEAVTAAVARIAGQQIVDSLGVAVPGQLGRDLQSTEIIPNLAGRWRSYPLATALRETTALPATLINDARAFATAELSVGAARDRSEVVFLTMGTGVGGAIALGGSVLRGPGDRLGEIGHLLAVPGGLTCTCGARGCLETVAGGRALARAWSQVVGADGRDGGALSTPEDLVRAALDGDAMARRILDEAGTAVGAALGSVLALLGVNTVVIGGGIAPAFELMRPAAERALEARTALIGAVELLTTQLGTSAGAIGAAIHATRSRQLITATSAALTQAEARW
jgi:glucokinase